jgi:hypothetical protein
VAWDTPCRSEPCQSKPWLATGINKRPVGAPQAQDEPHRYATRRTPSDEGLWGYDLNRLERGGAELQDHTTQGVRRDGTAGMLEAEVPDFHEAFREDVLEEAVDTRDDVESGGTLSSTTGFTVGEGDGAVVESHETLVGDGDPEDRGGEVGEGRVAIGPCLRMDVPGEVPDLWVDVFQQSGLAHVFFEEGTGDGREGFDGDEEGGSGGAPGHTIL